MLIRDQDIVAMIGGRAVHIEVKSYRRAAISEWQVIKDLVRHAPDDYRTLMYMYDPEAAGELSKVGEKMLALFGDASTPPHPDLVKFMSEAWYRSETPRSRRSRPGSNAAC